MQSGIWWFLFVLLSLSLVSQPLPGLAAEDPMNGPWEEAVPDVVLTSSQGGTQEAVPASAGFFRALLVSFQKVISPVDGDRCPSYPTCSAYSLEAYEKHGAVVGTLMTVDRLIHEACEGQFAPAVEVHGVRRIYDPVSANEFWKRSKRMDWSQTMFGDERTD